MVIRRQSFIISKMLPTTPLKTFAARKIDAEHALSGFHTAFCFAVLRRTIDNGVLAKEKVF